MYYQKRKKRKKKVLQQRRKRETEGFLNRYDFPYAGRDVVNQAAKVVSGVIKDASNKINNFVKQRIDQITSQGGE